MFAFLLKNYFIVSHPKSLLMRFLKSLFLFAASTLAVLTTTAQVTTSSLSGTVRSAGGELLAGASIKLTHVPTGTTVSASTAKNGRFNVANIQPGGPYTIEVSFVGFKTQTRNDVFVDLGETGRADFTLSSSMGELTEVVVKATRTPQQVLNGGIGTSISAEKLDNIPTVGRNLTDFIRLTPQAKTTYGGGISIAGQNNRYNQIMFDGAVNNDVFGLSETGTNGGQTGSSPISIDAIESFQIGVSPYDVSLGNFTGGAVNAITKSGTNTMKGSAYWVNRNQDFVAKNPIGLKSAATKFPNFQANTFGATLGGAFIKNKLFYFVSAEFQRDERPQPFDPTTFRTPPGSLFQDSVALIVNKLKSYGYDPGDYLNVPDLINSDKIAAKISWNINSKHRLNASYRYTNTNRYLTTPSNTSNVNFFNGGYLIPSLTNSASLELNSRFSNKISNKLLVTYTNVFDDRDPIGKPFPRVLINSFNGQARYNFGTEAFSAGNQLKQNNFAVYDEFRYNIGSHQIKAGVDIEFSNSYNLFVRNNYGSYTYAWVKDFIEDRRPTRFEKSYSLRDNIIGDGSAAGAEFQTLRAGIFLGDQWQVSDKLELNYGVRIDNFEFITTPNEDKYFNETALPIISSVWDMKGARSGQRPQPQLSWSPRLGFTYEAMSDLKIKGGLGLFTGRVPLVWPGGVYNNTGINIGGILQNNPNITFRPDPLNQYSPSDFGTTVSTPSGQIDLIAKDFKLPKVLKASIGFEKDLGNGWKLNSDFLYQKNINEIVYYNVMGSPGAKNALGQTTYIIPGQTSSYNRFDFNPAQAGIQNPYSEGIFIIANGEKDKGFSYNFTTSIDKRFAKGWMINLSYGYGDSYTLFDGTSSQNNSQWRYVEAKNGRNNIALSRSDFAQLHRINSFVSKRFSYADKKLATTISMFYNGQSGTPYSYVYSRSMIYDRNGVNDESTDLIYVPKDLADFSRFATDYTSNGVLVKVAQQWDALDKFISNDKHLNSRRGQFADRNGAILPWSHILDLKVQQDVIFGKGKYAHKVSFIFDVFNFTNMLNREWGRINITPGVDAFSLLTMDGYSNVNGVLTPTITYRNLSNRPAYDILDQRSGSFNTTRWRGQFTVKYTF